jgi:hypothetical protein
MEAGFYWAKDGDCEWEVVKVTDDTEFGHQRILRLGTSTDLKLGSDGMVSLPYPEFKFGNRVE